MGHELASLFEVKDATELEDIVKELETIVSKFHVGKVTITECSEETIKLQLEGHASSRDLINKNITSETPFCSFEAGILAGIVEKITNLHCFAQELSCSLQSNETFCEFLIVFQRD